VNAILSKHKAEAISSVLYPDDRTYHVSFLHSSIYYIRDSCEEYKMTLITSIGSGLCGLDLKLASLTEVGTTEWLELIPVVLNCDGGMDMCNNLHWDLWLFRLFILVK
jgi:hypothetical protein